MRHVGHVSGEGGPLLLADATVARGWRGARNGARDYLRACALFDGRDPEPDAVAIALPFGNAILWELHGAGTADVFRSNDEVMLLRAWLDDEAVLDELAEADGEDAHAIGELDVRSGALALLWAPEDGACFDDEVLRRGGRPAADATIEGAALVLKLPPGRYEVWHDVVEVDGGFARRCRLVAAAL